ncbi:acetylxylan esterase [Streptomyces sp. NPDC050509]|uniref:acetylxylan esterase n=1 Tax=Streptomyces sp. NPDC050509 TaxID=3365620 RepID=UPI0037BB2B2B
MPVFEHGFPFDPAYGRTLDRLLALPAPAAPPDFDAFWQARYEAARRVATAPAVGPQEEERDGFRIFGVSFTSVGGLRLGGWLVLPADGPAEHGFVVGHGYGGRQDAADAVPLPLPRSAAILPCVRGLGARSRRPGIPGEADLHVLHGIESRHTYVIGDCVADLWCAASALLELVPELARDTGTGTTGVGEGTVPGGAALGGGFGGGLGYVGESLGGGLGALALPWDDRFACGQLTVPTFGDHPLRLTLPGVGSGEAVRKYRRDHPEVTDVLPYFDAATAASRIRVPVLVAPALFDPAVPPPGQFAVYNALAGPRELHVLLAGHFEHAGGEQEAKELASARQRFFAERLPNL